MENVTEELVRQNGNQAAAVMADYASQGGGGGGSTGGASGVVIQDGSVVNGLSFRQATEADVAKFTDGGVEVGQSVLEINGVIPYVMQVDLADEDPSILLLTSLVLSEHSVYYVSCGTSSPGVNASFEVVLFYISDDATLLAPHQAG